MKLSLQLYSARDAGPLADVLRLLADLGFDAVEGYGGVFGDLSALQGLLAETGLAMPSLHVALDLVESDPDQVARIAEATGAGVVFAPHLTPEQRPQDAVGWAAIADRLAAAHAAMAERGLRFGWHNHDFEFVPLPDGQVPMQIILDRAPMIEWEADIAWIIRGGADPLDWIARHGPRITAAHFKDIAPTGECGDEDGWADPGTGIMDWPAIIAALRTHARVEWLVAEHDRPADFDRFARQAARAWATI
ncbi:sugar phosphate isomerase/epimerase family protein [Paracoccus sp. NSM]|uniref:sugar phosphate isomerase/epimerase family protein n=1 Tax=Paracoccus sp. NSM TaxID=3457784 RepID=UPI0040356CD8